MTTDAAKAYERLKHKIITLELAPGSVIQDGALVQELGLGRTPIREALKLLEAEDLVITVARRGVFVSQVSITDLQQISEIRAELEGLSARLAASRAGPLEVGSLLAHCVEHSEADLGHVAARIDLDRKIHYQIAAATHNRFLESEVQRFYDLSMRLWNLALERIPAPQVDVCSHVAVVAAIEARDEPRAEALMREHIRQFQQTVKGAM